MFGFQVAHTHTIGHGFPDVVVSRKGRTQLIEIKDGSKPPSARKLTDDEKDFHMRWEDHIPIIESLDDVENFATKFNK